MDEGFPLPVEGDAVVQPALHHRHGRVPKKPHRKGTVRAVGHRDVPYQHILPPDSEIFAGHLDPGWLMATLCPQEGGISHIGLPVSPLFPMGPADLLRDPGQKYSHQHLIHMLRTVHPGPPQPVELPVLPIGCQHLGVSGHPVDQVRLFLQSHPLLFALISTNY